MTKQREALLMALEALDSDNPDIMLRASIAIREALAELEPLTDEQIDAAWRSVDYTQSYENFRIAIARAIERAHGITE